MTVTTTLDRQYFPGDGANKNFPFNFKFFDNSQIFVYLIDPLGTVIGKTLNVDYTLSGANSPVGGTVVFSVAPPNLYRVLVQRIIPQVQPTSIRNQGAFFPATHEDVFDRLTMLIQQSIAESGNSLKLDKSGSFWDFSGKAGKNAADPVDAQDVATKNWVGLFIDSISGIVNTTMGIAYDASNLFTYLRFSNSRTTDTIASLRAISSSRNQRALVLGYYARGDYFPLSYSVDQDDTTSSDDGFSVIVASDGARWKPSLSGYIDVRWAGAKPDNTTDSYAAIQRCITYAGAAGISKIYVFGKYVITDTLVVDYNDYFKGVNIEGGSALIDQIRQTGNNKDAFWWSTTQYLRNSTLKDVGIYCMANAGHGVNIKLGCTLNRFQDVNVTVLNPTKSCYTGIWSGIALGAPQGVFDTTWEGGDLYITNAHTVFGIDFVTNGTTFNENNFRRMRWNNGNTLQFARFTNVDTATYLEGNTIDGINYEICSGGGIFLTNAKGWKISTQSFWDQAGSYKNHLIHFGSNAGLESINNVLELVKRNGDTMAAGKRDIFIEAGQDTTLINCFVDAANSPSYDFNNKRVCVIGPVLSGVINGTYLSYVNSLHNVTASASFSGVTAVATEAMNIGSIVRSAAGLYRVKFTSPRTNTDYQVHCSTSTEVLTIWQVSNNLDFFDIKISIPTGPNQDMLNVRFKVFG